MDVHEDILTSKDNFDKYIHLLQTRLNKYPCVSMDMHDSVDLTRISMVTRISLRIAVLTKHGPLDLGSSHYE